MYIYIKLLLAALVLIVGAIIGILLKSPLWRLARAFSGAWSPSKIGYLKGRFKAFFEKLWIVSALVLFIVIVLSIGYDYLIHSPLEYGAIPQAASNLFWRLVYITTFVLGFALALDGSTRSGR